MLLIHSLLDAARKEQEEQGKPLFTIIPTENY
jgi:hypothetical protein